MIINIVTKVKNTGSSLQRTCRIIRGKRHELCRHVACRTNALGYFDCTGMISSQCCAISTIMVKYSAILCAGPPIGPIRLSSSIKYFSTTATLILCFFRTYQEFFSILRFHSKLQEILDKTFRLFQIYSLRSRFYPGLFSVSVLKI